MNSEAFFRELDRVRDIPTLPAMVMEANRLLEDMNTSVGDLCAVIEKDQAMTMKILKLVNSSFYGLPSQISNIRNAIIVLGYNTVRNAIMTLTIMKLMPKKGMSIEGFSVSELWSHAVEVGVLSRHLAELAGVKWSNDCFVAGLLHDIGKVILFRFFPAMFEAVVAMKRSRRIRFFEAEKALGHVDHAVIGGVLGEKWLLPPILIEAIRCHHEIPDHAEDGSPVLLVHAANQISHATDEDPESACHSRAVPYIRMYRSLDAKKREEIQIEIDACNRFFREG
ncbi:HDOD domain-containing protein [Desulfatirhabdium butyrativorans]|uniref:HDOD domain-containing protein n=1 Tax=Desulfatirhabdium butyrativorans TaxID=340467 RepID=UPI000419A045|nr:HDOD domain-containing protein [Desulfatirhabdium butyrativorans]